MTSSDLAQLTTGERIKRIASFHGVAQTDIARLLGYTPSAISQKLAGHSPIKIEELALIADYLKVSTDYLLGREESQR